MQASGQADAAAQRRWRYDRPAAQRGAGREGCRLQVRPTPQRSGGGGMTEVSAVRPGPPLARGVLDRAAHRRTDADWLAGAWTRSRVVVVDDGHVLVRGD